MATRTPSYLPSPAPPSAADGAPSHVSPKGLSSASGVSCFLTDWLEQHPTPAISATVTVFGERPGARPAALTALGPIVADHLYGAETLERLGYSKAAAAVTSVLPVGKKIRSGDLGEILATEYVARRTEYRVPVKRLRYKDDREMSMRGDDVIGIATSGPLTGAASAAVMPAAAGSAPAAADSHALMPRGPGRTRVLKVEVKSRAALGQGTVGEACQALDANDGRPKPSTLAFLAHKLRLTGRDDEAELFEQLQERQVRVDDVAHLVFVFSGNNPTSALTAHAVAGTRPIPRALAGLQISDHAAFIATVFQHAARHPLNVMHDPVAVSGPVVPTTVSAAGAAPAILPPGDAADN